MSRSCEDTAPHGAVSSFFIRIGYQLCPNGVIPHGITGKYVCIDVMLQWINGTDVPRHRHAVQKSMQLFLGGAAGILKPVRTTSYPPIQRLVRAGTGLFTAANQKLAGAPAEGCRPRCVNYQSRGPAVSSVRPGCAENGRIFSARHVRLWRS